MNYDRVRVKGLARAAIRRGRPRPWTVTLVYTLLTTLPGAGLSFLLITTLYILPLLGSFSNSTL